MQHVLIIDDEARISKLAKTALLHIQHCEIGTVESGAEALDHLKESGPADLVLCDIQLGGEDGLAVAAHLQQLGLAQEIVMTSGLLAARALDLGWPVVTKPFSPALLEMIVSARIQAKPVVLVAQADIDVALSQADLLRAKGYYVVAGCDDAQVDVLVRGLRGRLVLAVCSEQFVSDLGAARETLGSPREVFAIHRSELPCSIEDFIKTVGELAPIS